MTGTLTTPPKHGHRSFLYADLASDLDHMEADIAFIGVPYGSPYRMEDVSNDQSNMASALRQASDRILRAPERYDFDLGGTLFDGKAVRFVDCGDVVADPRDIAVQHRNTETAIRKIVKAGAMPLISGGDHAVPIPVLRAFEGRGPIHVIQIDQHLDWRDHVDGVRDGLSSPMRRASEMAHVDQLFQIGLRASGSARPEEVAAAQAYGAHLITARELHRGGIDAVLDRIPAGANYYITVDMDGMDSSLAPGVAAPMPGGVTYWQAVELIHGLVAKGRVVGMDVVEATPRTDVNKITLITAGRLFLNLIGMATRAGYFDRASAS